MAAPHLRGYAGVSAEVPGGQNAEGVRRESEYLSGAREASPPASEASDEPRSGEQVPLNKNKKITSKCCTYMLH